jgi:hypothetical protein
MPICDLPLDCRLTNDSSSGPARADTVRQIDCPTPSAAIDRQVDFSFCGWLFCLIREDEKIRAELANLKDGPVDGKVHPNVR